MVWAVVWPTVGSASEDPASGIRGQLRDGIRGPSCIKNIKRGPENYFTPPRMKPYSQPPPGAGCTNSPPSPAEDACAGFMAASPRLLFGARHPVVFLPRSFSPSPVLPIWQTVPRPWQNCALLPESDNLLLSPNLSRALYYRSGDCRGVGTGANG